MKILRTLAFLMLANYSLLQAQTQSGLPYAGSGLTVAAQPSPTSTTILQALNNAKNAPVHVAVIGDSYTVACKPEGFAVVGPANCANRWAEVIRVRLQLAYGSHGTGVYPVIVASSSAINNQAWTCTGSFSVTSTLGPGSTLISLGPSASCTFHDNRNIAWDTLNTYCGTNSTSVGIAVNIDSGAFTGTACGSTTGSATAHVVTLAATSSASHSVTFTNPAGSGNAFLYAAEGQAGTTGVSVDNMGFGGGTAGSYGSAVATQLAFSDLIPGGTQALILMDQTNDASTGVPTGTFSANIQNIITHEQALASAPTVMLAIPPVSVVNNTDPLGPYTAVQVGLCSSNSLTCINVQNRGAVVGSTAVGWGATFPGCPNVLWDCAGSLWPTGNGGLHTNDAGNLDEAQLIYAAVVNPTLGSTAITAHQFLGNGTASTALPAPFLIGTSDWSPNSYVAGAGLVNVMTATLSPAATALVAGLEVDVLPNLANTTTTPTLNVNGLGAKTITKLGTTVLAAGDYTVLAVAKFIYDGTEWQLQNPQTSSGGCATNCTFTGTGASAGITVNSAAAVGEVFNSTNASGNFLEIQGTGTNVNNWALASASSSISTANSGRQLLFGDLTAGIYMLGISFAGTSKVETISTAPFCWASGSNIPAQNCDTGLSRDAAGAIDAGNGAQGDKSATFQAAKGVFSTFDTAAGFQSIGTKFTTTGCSVSATTGGGSAGVFTLGANTCSVVVTMNGATGLTATNGWSCFANDRTSATVFAIQQTASSATTATFSIPATAGATDVINFGCTAY